MISSRQIFSCTVLPVSSVFVSVVCAFSLCSKAWSIFQENVIPVPGLFTRSRLHQRSETRSPQCSCYESARVHARQHSGDTVYATHSWVHKLLSANSPNYPSARSCCPIRFVLTRLTHTQIPSLRDCPAGDVPAEIRPLKMGWFSLKACPLLPWSAPIGHPQTIGSDQLPVGAHFLFPLPHRTWALRAVWRKSTCWVPLCRELCHYCLKQQNPWCFPRLPCFSDTGAPA